jgi:hypothetical protein
MTDEARGATMWYSKTGDDKAQEIGYKKGDGRKKRKRMVVQEKVG